MSPIGVGLPCKNSRYQNNIVFLITCLSFAYLASTKTVTLNEKSKIENSSKLFASDYHLKYDSFNPSGTTLYTNQFALRLVHGTDPELIAKKHDLTHLGQVSKLTEQIFYIKWTYKYSLFHVLNIINYYTIFFMQIFFRKS